MPTTDSSDSSTWLGGGIHAFLLDTTVHPDWRQRGIGRQLVLQAITVARELGIEWLHVDDEPHLEGFIVRLGFNRHWQD